MHVMRVGSDGSYSDMVVTQWTDSFSLVSDPNGGTRTETGGPVSIDTSTYHMITNADTGAVFSWQVFRQNYCALETASGCIGSVDSVLEYHLATTAGTSVASDVVWNQVVPNQYYDSVEPVLQLEDGSFVGIVNN